MLSKHDEGAEEGDADLGVAVGAAAASSHSFPPLSLGLRIEFVWAAFLVNGYKPWRELRRREGGRRLHSCTMTFDRV